MIRYHDDDGNQIVECGQYAFVWPSYYPPLVVGEQVYVSDRPHHGSILTRVTQVGSELGGAIGFVTGRAGG